MRIEPGTGVEATDDGGYRSVRGRRAQPLRDRPTDPRHEVLTVPSGRSR